MGTGGSTAAAPQTSIPSLDVAPLPPLAEVLAGAEPAGDGAPHEPEHRSTPAPARPHRPRRLLFLLALLAAIGIRLACVATDDVPTTDATAYLRSGASLWAGEGFERDGAPELHFPPGTPVLLGGAELLVGDEVLATTIVFLVFGTALLVPLAGIARHLGGDDAAVVAAWLGALAPALSILPVQQGGGSEAPFTFLVLLATWLALSLPSTSPRRQLLGAAALGLLLGLAYLVRPEALFLLPVVLAALVFAGWRTTRGRRAGLRRSAGLVAACLVVLAALAAPYVAHLHASTGRWELTAKTQDASLDAWRDVAERDRRSRDATFYALDDTGLALRNERSTLVQLVRSDPAGYAGIVATNLRALATEVGLRWSVLPVVVTAFAAWGAWCLRHRRATWLVLATLATTTLPAVVFFVLPRYLIPSAALLVALAAVGLTRLPRRAQGPVATLTGVLLVGALLGGLGAPSHLGAPREPIEHRLVGEWLAAQAAPGDSVMTRNQVTEHYAGLELVPLPAASVAEVVRFAQHYGTDWLVVDEYRLRYLRPQLDPLFEDGPWPGLRLVHELEVDGRVTRVFVLDPPPDEDDVVPPPGDASFVADVRAGG